jgi:hypothetical protein
MNIKLREADALSRLPAWVGGVLRKLDCTWVNTMDSKSGYWAIQHSLFAITEKCILKVLSLSKEDIEFYISSDRNDLAMYEFKGDLITADAYVEKWLPLLRGRYAEMNNPKIPQSSENIALAKLPIWARDVLVDMERVWVYSEVASDWHWTIHDSKYNITEPDIIKIDNLRIEEIEAYLALIIGVEGGTVIYRISGLRTIAWYDTIITVNEYVIKWRPLLEGRARFYRTQVGVVDLGSDVASSVGAVGEMVVPVITAPSKEFMKDLTMGSSNYEHIYMLSEQLEKLGVTVVFSEDIILNGKDMISFTPNDQVSAVIMELEKKIDLFTKKAFETLANRFINR